MCGNENVLKLTVVGGHNSCRYIHLIVHFKSVSCIVYKWHLKAVMLKISYPFVLVIPSNKQTSLT